MDADLLDRAEDILDHSGVKGMKWGVRSKVRARKEAKKAAYKALSPSEKRAYKAKKKTDRDFNVELAKGVGVFAGFAAMPILLRSGDKLVGKLIREHKTRAAEKVVSNLLTMNGKLKVAKLSDAQKVGAMTVKLANLRGIGR